MKLEKLCETFVTEIKSAKCKQETSVKTISVMTEEKIIEITATKVKVKSTKVILNKASLISHQSLPFLEHQGRV